MTSTVSTRTVTLEGITMVEWPTPKFSKLRMLFWLGHCISMDLQGDPCFQDNFTFNAKVEKCLRYKNKKKLEPRRKKFILIERIGKVFLEKKTIKWILSYKENLKDKHFPPKGRGQN